MIKCLTSGGLGDALMSIAKLHSKDAPFKITDDIHVTHVEVPANLLVSIKELYDSQGIKCTVKQIPNSDWVDEHRHEYDYFLGTSWSSKNARFDSWEIEPFPNLRFSRCNWFGIAVNPCAGRENTRRFSPILLQKFFSYNYIHMDIAYVGLSDVKYAKEVSTLRGLNLLNRTSLSLAMDIVGSATMFIGHPGFFTFLACMLEVPVYLGSIYCKDYYFHPKWWYKVLTLPEDV